jgi:hypothetical protein
MDQIPVAFSMPLRLPACHRVPHRLAKLMRGRTQEQ